jgi:ParB/RepB/Spo0J family partition protein
MQFMRVSLNQVLMEDSEAEFSFSYERDVAALAQSIEKIGLVNPPSLRRAGEKFEIICGLNRAKACRRLGHREIPALVYEPAELSDEQCLWFSLLDSEGTGRLSPVEQSIVLNKFHRAGYHMVRLMGEIGPRIGLPQSFSYIENHLRLLSLEREILHAIHKGEFGAEQTFPLLAVKSEARVALFKLLALCKTNVNETRELIPLVLDTAAIKGVEPADFVAGQAHELLLKEPDSPRKRLQILREHLKKERYPSICSAEAKFNELAGKLALGTRCRIEGPKYFEGDEIALTIRAANHEQIDDVIGKLARPEARETIQALFKLLKGDHAQ